MANRSHKKTAFILASIFVAMVGVSYAAVPLYKMFCAATGFGGTTQVAKSLPATTGQRTITVRFNTDVDPNLPWSFQPDVREVKIKTGEVGKASFHAVNKGDEAVVGSATYGVTPEKTAIYFNKIQCFCFTAHMLKPGESAEFPVTFFIDPALEADPNLYDVETITLSYTFFKAKNQDLLKVSASGKNNNLNPN
jgi:cytochrome c oxidase assembly protein subunit 11